MMIVHLRNYSAYLKLARIPAWKSHRCVVFSQNDIQTDRISYKETTKHVYNMHWKHATSVKKKTKHFDENAKDRAPKYETRKPSLIWYDWWKYLIAWYLNAWHIWCIPKKASKKKLQMKNILQSQYSVQVGSVRKWKKYNKK